MRIKVTRGWGVLGSWMLDGTGCWILDAGYWMELDAGYWMLDTGCWMLDTGCWILDTGWNWMLDVSFHSLTYFCKPVSGIYTEWNC